MNLVILTGFVKEVRFFGKHKRRHLVIISLACKSAYTPSKKTDYFNIVAYGPLATMCGTHLKNDMMIQVVGVLTRSRYKRDDDTEHTVTQVQATNVNLCMHRASAEFLDAALLLSAEAQGAVEVEDDEEDGDEEEWDDE